MKIGIIGIGDICKKAYLPIITLRDDIKIILCSRNQDTINNIKSTYRLLHSTNSIDELIKFNIDAAFVHSSTESHFEICKKLIENKISVYVDKPIAFKYSEVEELYKLSKDNNVKFMVGFNRRFAPKLKELPSLGIPDLVIMQKNRLSTNQDIRTFIFDDFIHVIDTVRFLMGNEATNITIDGKKENGILKNIVIKLSNTNTTAIAIMNKQSGIAEETVEYMTNGKKAIVQSLTETTLYTKGNKIITGFGDWDNTLYKRGFVEIINSFIDSVKNNTELPISIEDSVETHKICDKIVFVLEEK